MVGTHVVPGSLALLWALRTIGRVLLTVQHTGESVCEVALKGVEEQGCEYWEIALNIQYQEGQGYFLFSNARHCVLSSLHSASQCLESKSA